MTDEARPAGTIYDLGYKRYVGSRRPASMRWRAIMRHQIATSWKTWWRFKAVLGATVITTVVAGGVIYALHDEIFSLFSQGTIVRTFADSVLPASIQWYCRMAFVLSLTVASGVVAADMQSGAFTFYFARSIRPRDYVFGKLAGLAVLFGAILIVGPLLIGGLQVGLAGTDELVATLPVLGKALAIGVLATLAYSSVPLAFSALVPNRRYTLAIWAAYYLIVGVMALGLGMAVWSPLAAIDLSTALRIVTYRLFDVQFRFGPETNLTFVAALIGIGAHIAIAIAILLSRVSHAQRTGVGGAS